MVFCGDSLNGSQTEEGTNLLVLPVAEKFKLKKNDQSDSFDRNCFATVFEGSNEQGAKS